MWNVSKYGDFSGPYFPAFGLNYEVSLRVQSEWGKILRIQSECGKIQPRKDSVLGRFSRSGWSVYIFLHLTFLYLEYSLSLSYFAEIVPESNHGFELAFTVIFLIGVTESIAKSGFIYEIWTCSIDIKYLTLLLSVPRWPGANTNLLSNSNILKTVIVNIAFTLRVLDKLSNDMQVDRLCSCSSIVIDV